ncbi:MAG: hypothetical protein RLZZ455_300 [Candidatus Parcubacteria bacterium]|jgi:hypothetical protein
MKNDKLSLFINDITEYIFVAGQKSEAKRTFIVTLIAIFLSSEEIEQQKTIRHIFGVDSWSEGLLNMICGNPLFRDSFNGFVKEDEEKPSQAKTSIDKQ